MHISRVLAFKNTTKIQREDTQRDGIRAKLWAVPAGGGSGVGWSGAGSRGVHTNNHNHTQQHTTGQLDWPKLATTPSAGLPKITLFFSLFRPPFCSFCQAFVVRAHVVVSDHRAQQRKNGSRLSLGLDLPAMRWPR